MHFSLHTRGKLWAADNPTEAVAPLSISQKPHGEYRVSRRFAPTHTRHTHTHTHTHTPHTPHTQRHTDTSMTTHHNVHPLPMCERDSCVWRVCVCVCVCE